MKKNILSLAALLIASATFVACSSDDNIINEQPTNPTGKYTMTINASKGGDATTRALSLGRNDADTKNVLNATWATTENIYVKKGDTWATGSLQPDANAATATLKGELSGITIAKDDVLTLQFPKSGAISYDGQVGTLEDIAANFDYATASVTVASVSATGNIIPTEATTTFANQQAIIKFTLKEKANDAAISPSALTVTDGTSTVELTSIPAATYTANGGDNNVLYVAFPAAGSAKTITLTATVGSDTYTFEKAGITFTNGQYYEITVKMKKAPAGTTVDLSTLTGAYEAQDGDVLTGTLAANVKITIADGATVTLSGAVINGTNSSSWAGLTLAGDGTIILSGVNSVKGFYDEYPGIFVPENKTLTIQGDGSLTASSNGWAAGIGGGYEKACGNITIEGGTINAQGGSDAAGIGGGYNTSCGNISITGGTVTATGGNYAAGIGSGSSDGYDSSCGNITITDGVTNVTATAGQNAPNSIGVGMGGSCGTVTIGGTVYPDGISTSPYTYDPSASAPAAPALNITSPSVGQVIGSDGKNYAYGSLPTGVTKVAMIAYVSGTNGLAIAIADEEGTMNWDTAVTTAAAHTPTFTGGTWRLPTQNEWKQMFASFGGNNASYSGLNTAITAAGGTALVMYSNYCSSTESGSNVYYAIFSGSGVDWQNGSKTLSFKVRPCLAF